MTNPQRNNALVNTTDTDKTSNGGKRNDIATPQSTVSERSASTRVTPENN